MRKLSARLRIKQIQAIELITKIVRATGAQDKLEDVVFPQAEAVIFFLLIWFFVFVFLKDDLTM